MKCTSLSLATELPGFVGKPMVNRWEKGKKKCDPSCFCMRSKQRLRDRCVMKNRTEAKKNKRNHNHKRPGIAIVGNMNVGKSTLFSRMCNNNAKSINLSGTTVSINLGHIKGTDKDAFDTPGIFSIFSANEDERASRDILLPQVTDCDVRGIILVADAKNMKRSIAIALQYAEYGLPMLLDLNMIDESTSRGIEIDYGKLSETLGTEILA